MIVRRKKEIIQQALARQAAVAVIGPRQVGKTTLAREIAQEVPSVYIDLESPKDRAKLEDPELFFSQHEDKLVVLDEIHRMPEVFQILRGVIDERRAKGKRANNFLILGSASIDLLKQSGETLAGRIEYVNMDPLTVSELPPTFNEMNKLWLRGGFPDSFLARSDEESFIFRENFIRTYLERDVPMFGPRIPGETLNRLWTMLAYNQGTLLNHSKLAANFGIAAPTIARYIDLFVDLLLIRKLPPFYANVNKRLVKSPKTYVRDSGLLHALLNIHTYDELLGNPIVGASWEGFVIENILANLPNYTKASFYRTATGIELDLLLEIGGKQGKWAIEVKKGLSPKKEKGLMSALEDLETDRVYIVYSGEESYPLSSTIQVISLQELVQEAMSYCDRVYQ